VPESDDDFQEQLARAALDGREINLGSPTAKSTALAVIARWPPLAAVRPVDPAAYRQGALF